MKIALIIAALIASPAQAQWRKVSDAEAIRLWYVADEQCRDTVPLDRVCIIRDMLTISLSQHGWCNPYPDWRDPARYRFHRCEKMAADRVKGRRP